MITEIRKQHHDRETPLMADESEARSYAAVTIPPDSEEDSSPDPRSGLSRKGSKRVGGGDTKLSLPPPMLGGTTTAAATVTTAACEKLDFVVHVAGKQEVGVGTVPAGGARWRKLGRRSAVARFDPRRVLLLFATLSSMGTLILLYFIFSMGKMAGSVADTQ